MTDNPYSLHSSSDTCRSSAHALSFFSALIIFGVKAQPVIQICIIENDMTMQVVFIIMNSDNILIIAFEITVTQFLSNLHSLFGCDFFGSKALYQVICEDLGAPCALLSDCSEVLACS